MFFIVRSPGETCRILKSGFENNVLFQNVRKSDNSKNKSGVWVDQNVIKLGPVFSERNKNVWAMGRFLFTQQTMCTGFRTLIVQHFG